MFPPAESATTAFLPAAEYDLAGTLAGGQAFRWEARAGWWEGVVHGRWVRLRRVAEGLHAQVAIPVPDWEWLRGYLRLEDDLPAIPAAFPDDPPLQAAVRACRGLRLLRQEPWECLASFMLSATKQIVQIRQCVELLGTRFGEPVAVPPGHPPAHAFPSPARLAAVTEAGLRACKTGFRAPRLHAAAEAVATGRLDLEALRRLPCPAARAELMRLAGVGRKIADCVLLFAYGFQEAFPVDVWVLKALRELYFPRRRPPPARLRR
ncbi:MAG TPA: DNA glycosylase, partial [Verrucomicrobiota bacterium]|nr:DNA glycosylase [Verrucomicrobiota bacterium]